MQRLNGCDPPEKNISAFSDGHLAYMSTLPYNGGSKFAEGTAIAAVPAAAAVAVVVAVAAVPGVEPGCSAVSPRNSSVDGPSS